ncbi:unnamed protein product [Paramecium octaurelia]|uniref:Uncharacterized protein n=1 Tax=Paramecium octaurelia TaxID=43137 RepID=A0A8S1VPC2_PAROT|nr:unnamed protein product [Paramecium octaurelia]
MFFKLVKTLVQKNYRFTIANMQNTIIEFTIQELNFSTNFFNEFITFILPSISDLAVIVTKKCQEGKQLIVHIPKNNGASPINIVLIASLIIVPTIKKYIFQLQLHQFRN